MSLSPSGASLALVVVAAGSGTRLGAAEPKAFVSLRGRTLLAHAVGGILGASEPATIVVVAPADRVDEALRIARDAGAADAIAVAGGVTRQASVAAGLAALGALDPPPEVVLVHDAARALTPAALIDRVAAAVRTSGSGVVPVLPVTDTVKTLDRDGAVTGTVDRSTLGAVQTPQGFPFRDLVDAYAEADVEHTDDAALFAAAGGLVGTVAGEPDGFKITTPWDLARAESLLGGASGAAVSATAPVVRTGLGIDVHAYDASAELWLGGLHWPGEAGLAGHSDGDAVVHAICDALLSAAGLGDLGSRFGSADPRFAGARSAVFLVETLRLVADAGFAVGNVAVQLVANRPRVGPRRGELEEHLSAVVGAPVSVSATTSDGLGFTGRGEGVSALATALLVGRG